MNRRNFLTGAATIAATALAAAEGARTRDEHAEPLHLSDFAAAAYQTVLDLNATQRIASIVDSSDDAVVSMDLHGIISTWNRGAERIFGYTAEQVIGKSVNMLIPPDRQDEEPAILERVRRGVHGPVRSTGRAASLHPHGPALPRAGNWLARRTSGK